MIHNIKVNNDYHSCSTYDNGKPALTINYQTKMVLYTKIVSSLQCPLHCFNAPLRNGFNHDGTYSYLDHMVPRTVTHTHTHTLSLSSFILFNLTCVDGQLHDTLKCGLLSQLGVELPPGKHVIQNIPQAIAQGKIIVH